MRIVTVTNRVSPMDPTKESNESEKEEEKKNKTGVSQRGASIVTAYVAASAGTGASMETLLQGPNVQSVMTQLEKKFNAGGDQNIIQWWDILKNQMTTGQQTPTNTSRRTVSGTKPTAPQLSRTISPNQLSDQKKEHHKER